MLDKLIEILILIWESFVPCYSVLEYEEGVAFRLGKYRKDVHKGFHWKIPFADYVVKKSVVRDTFHVANMDITTTDGKTISVGGIIEFEIADIKKHLVDVNDAMSNAHDIARGIIADYLTDCSWEECKDKKTLTAIKNKLKPDFQDMGMSIKKVLFGDISVSRIFTINNKH